MDILFSTKLMDDLEQSIQSALAKGRIINIPLLAEQIRRRNEADNVALEDIEARLLLKAQLFNLPVEFDSSPS